MNTGPTDTLILAKEVFGIQGAGFLEGVYQECLQIELEYRGIPFIAQPPLRLEHRGRELKTRYAPDFICFEQIIVELKAVREIAPEHRAQLINYLRATNLKLGLLVNFGSPNKAEIVRMAL